MIMFYTSKIISRMQFLTLEVATQKAETRISCNTIATWSSNLERNADIDNCLETGLGLGLGLGLGADSSIEICAKPEATGGTRSSIPAKGEKVKGGEGERDSKGPQSPPPPEQGVTVAQIFCASLGGGQNNIMQTLLSRTEILSRA